MGKSNVVVPKIQLFPLEFAVLCLVVGAVWTTLMLTAGVSFVSFIETTANSQSIISPVLAAYLFASLSLLVCVAVAGFMWWKISLSLHIGAALTWIRGV